MPKIVQFLHTAVEAKPLNRLDSIIEWNNNKDHRRKFIFSEGKYAVENNEVVSKLTFWGEWEAQSKIVKLNNTRNGFPKYLNYPFINPGVPNRTHNTDPYVFGDNFKYIVCKQGYSEILRSLAPFSLIIFGSRINNKFCVDTIFVVSNEITKYSIDNIENIFTQRNTYYHASVNPLYDDTKYNKEVCIEDTCRIEKWKEYSFYKGVNFKQKEEYNGIYSFVPCKKFNKENFASYSFKQPEIELDILSTNQPQGINACNGKDFTVEEIVNYWNVIVSQLEKNYLQGTYFENPTLQ